jgi:hypothetical protein
MGEPTTPLGMTRDLTCRLAALHGASQEAAEASIALWELGDRLSLAAHGIIIDSDPDEDPEILARQGLPTDFALTDYGREIIDRCACWTGLITVH